MKKILALILVSLLVLAGCGKSNETPKGDAGLKIGTSVQSSVRTDNVGANERDKEHGKFESNVTYATVVIEDGKIKAVSIDTAQNEIKFTTTAVNEFVAKGTKKELGKDYGMNWHEQIAKLEAKLVGQSVEGITEKATSADLGSSVSIDINGYIDAVNAAIANATEVEGLVEFGQTSTVSSKIEDGKPVEINTVVSALGVDKDGKVVYSFIDEMQQKATIEGDKATPDANLKTKAQLGKDYGMNWHEQVAAISKHIVGKTAADVKKLDADVVSSVSIYTGGFEATVAKAFTKLTKI